MTDSLDDSTTAQNSDALDHTDARLDANYAETLWPGPTMWFAMILLSALITAALIPAGAPIAMIGLGVSLLLGTGALIASTPKIAVQNNTLTVRRHNIPLSALGEPTVLRGRSIKAAVGPQRDARAFICFRSEIRMAVQVPITDPELATPYWLISTRFPEQLVLAISSPPQSNLPQPGI